jgi:hypothetical protein
VEDKLLTRARRRGLTTWTAWRNSLAPRLVWALTVAVLLTACAGTETSPARSGRVVTSQYNGWTIRITPTLTDRWRARVQVWPPEVTPETHGGINPYFAESAATESAIVQAATASARRYIDASRGSSR